MAQPTTITNGETPDAVKLMAWFLWLAAGKGIKTGTYAELQAYAALTPTEPFDCWDTVGKQRLFYTGDTADGDGGFVLLATGGAPGTTTEVG